MILAFGSFTYKLLFLGHMVTAIAAFAPALVWPVLNRRRRVLVEHGQASETDLAGIEKIGILSPEVHGGAMVLTGLFGVGQILASNGAWAFDQMWISIAFLLWFLMLGLLFAGIVPTQRAVAEGKQSAPQRLAMAYGGMHLLLLLQVIVMIWKPGL